MATMAPTIDTLLNLVPDAPSSVLDHLRTHPDLASKQDQFGYSLVHASTSYEQFELLEALIQEFHVDPNILDEDGETCLFNAESVAIATKVIDLGVDVNVKNHDGLTAAEKLADEDEQPAVAAYILDYSSRHRDDPTTAIERDAEGSADISLSNGGDDSVRPPPPIPNGMQMSVGAMHADDIGEPDPEFRRRIEELAARQDFEGEESQSQLRDLISDAVSGLNNNGQGPATRRRVG